MTPTQGGTRLGMATCALTVSLAVLFVLAWGVFQVTGYVRLSGDARALRDSLLASADGNWERKVQLNVGLGTLTMARTVAAVCQLPPDAWDGVQAVRSAQVGVYRLRRTVRVIHAGDRLGATDAVMARRGMERVIGVVGDKESVLVYMPRGAGAGQELTLCLAVQNRRELVVVSARGKLDPLWRILERHRDVFPGLPQFVSQ